MSGLINKTETVGPCLIEWSTKYYKENKSLMKFLEIDNVKELQKRIVIGTDT